MMKISKKTQYGLRAMICIAREYGAKTPITVKSISEKEAIPFDFLEKIVSRLEKASLVKGRKGVQGGYMLSRPPAKISAKNIVSALEENDAPVNCRLCGRKSVCSSKNVWKKIENSLNSTLNSITLQSLLK